MRSVIAKVMNLKNPFLEIHKQTQDCKDRAMEVLHTVVVRIFLLQFLSLCSFEVGTKKMMI